MTKKELLDLAAEMKTNIESRYKWTLPTIKSVDIERQGNFTLVCVNKTSYGMTKRNPTDSYNPRTGLCMALNRAIYNLAEKQA